VKYETTPAFDGDLRRLSRAELEQFREVVQDRFIPAAEGRARDPAAPWPAALRVKAVTNAPGVWEMTWSFAGPDGRATFEWVVVDGEPAIRWRRVGGHAIFGSP
jgi:hypothetical protein